MATLLARFRRENQRIGVDLFEYLRIIVIHSGLFLSLGSVFTFRWMHRSFFSKSLCRPEGGESLHPGELS